MRNARIGLLLFLSVTLVNGVHPQSADLSKRNGVASHDGVDAIYQKFSQGYRELNAELVAGQYTQSAAYLAPDADILIGRQDVLSSFKQFFGWVRDNKQKIEISFDIVQRKIDANIGYDVGIYTLRTFKDGKEIGKGQGKFVVVAVKESNGQWRFQVDGYSGLKPPDKQK